MTEKPLEQGENISVIVCPECGCTDTWADAWLDDDEVHIVTNHNCRRCQAEWMTSE